MIGHAPNLRNLGLAGIGVCLVFVQENYIAATIHESIMPLNKHPKTFLAFFLLLAIGLSGCSRLEKPRPMQVHNGMVDLKGQGLTEPLSLDGEWEFHWMQLLSPDSLRNLKGPVDTLQVPGDWNHNHNPIRSGFGYATYRVRLFHPPPDLSFYLRHARCAYILYANGKEIASNGHVGTSAETTQGEYRTNRVQLPTDADTLDLVLQVANFTHRTGGIPNEVIISPSMLLSRLQANSSALDAAMAGILFFFSIYYLMFFVRLPQEHSALYAAGFCILISLRTLLMGQLLIKEILPGLSLDIMLRLEYATMSSVFFVFAYAERFFPGIAPRTRKVFSVINIILMILNWVLPAPYFTELRHGWMAMAFLETMAVVVVSVLSVRQHLPESKFFMISLLIPVFSTLQESLFILKILPTFYTTSAAIVIFLMFQSWLLSHRYARVRAEKEILSKKLIWEEEQQRELRRMHFRLKNLLDHADRAIAVTGDDGALIFCNQKFREIYGVSDESNPQQVSEIL
ncbi:MAG TPA: 7TM diverse intracellular signaling domain-containing protein, partial [Fibrobacteraceae bacterium]|nr:7TM diverse intracellular signaling domain-containing protein [Fibrobacteraceae bacterium]